MQHYKRRYLYKIEILGERSHGLRCPKPKYWCLGLTTQAVPQAQRASIYPWQTVEIRRTHGCVTGVTQARAQSLHPERHVVHVKSC